MSSTQKFLALGTANFGMKYGFTNRFTQLNHEQIRTLLESGLKLGFTWLDTAQAYGSAEGNLGQNRDLSHRYLISSKISNLREANILHLAAKVEASSLTIGKVPEIMYFHDLKSLLFFSREQIRTASSYLREKGLETQFGVSVYETGDILEVVRSLPDIRWMQIPLSVLDLGSSLHSTIKSLYQEGYRFVARSVFMQGILLTSLSNPRLQILSQGERFILRKFHSFCADHSLPPLAVALGSLMELEELSGIVLGVDSLSHLDELGSFISSPFKLNDPSNFGKKRGMFDLREKRFKE